MQTVEELVQILIHKNLEMNFNEILLDQRFIDLIENERVENEYLIEWIRLLIMILLVLFPLWMVCCVL